MEFRLLGPFEAHRDGRRVEVARRRQERRLLAILLLAEGRVVGVDRLVDLLWDGQPPGSARGVLQTYIGRLRSALRPHGPRILTHGDGYAAEVDADRVDALRFTGLAARAAEVADPSERTRLCDQALDLWRGPLLTDLVDERMRRRLDPGLHELRLATGELRAEALLALGQHDRVVAELTPLVDEHPTRERLVASLVTALHRCGRRADALRRYEQTRRVLVGDLGVEPGPDLRELHGRLLRDEAGADRPVYEVRVGDHWLPWNVGGHPALEFCNTYAGWGGPRRPGAEWLRGYPVLATWVGYQDLVDEPTVSWLLRQARANPVEAAAVLDEARQLRTHLYACLTDPGDARAFAGVARYAGAAARFSLFVRDTDGLGQWRLSRSAGLRLPVYAAARVAADLLADPRRYTVRVCADPECGWLFIDDSGRRRWCSLATCGSREQREVCHR